MTDPVIVYIALDIGEKRIGVAVANSLARLPNPLTTLSNDAGFVTALQKIIDAENAQQLIIGLPRGLDGQETAQTQYVRNFVASWQETIGLSIHWQDEAGTSLLAREKLAAEGKDFAKGDVDRYAAAYILDDFLRAQHVGAGA